MKDVLHILERWIGEGQPIVLGSVVERNGSAPRDPGAALAIAGNGEVGGGVTGGCVEPGVIDIAQEILAGGPNRLVQYGLNEEEGFDGLACGGTIAVAVYELDKSIVAPLKQGISADRAVAISVSLDEAHFGEQRLIFGDEPSDGSAVDAAARGLLEIGESSVTTTSDGEVIFVESVAPRPQLYLFGNSDIVIPLVTQGRFLGYRVTVCDARSVFMNRERFPDADEIVVEWPDKFLETAPIDASTAICMMTHDMKFDVPGLLKALASNAGYIGAIGSEKTRTERDARLRAAGISDADLARIHQPIGLQLNGRTPNEVAVAIGAQLVESNAVMRGARATKLPRTTVLT